MITIKTSYGFFLTKNANYLVKTNTMIDSVCDTHMKLFSWTNVINLNKTSHLKIINYDCNVSFYDVFVDYLILLGMMK